MGKLQVVVGGQYGSEGKGAVAAALAANESDLVAVRVAGPNAGHSVIATRGVPAESLCERVGGESGKVGISDAVSTVGREEWLWKFRAVPVAAVINPEASLCLAAGSEVDLAVLEREVDTLELAGYKVRQRLLVDPEATVLEPKHIEAETDRAMTARIGSTGKGIGAARADRLWRRAQRWADLSDEEYDRVGVDYQNVATMAESALRLGGTVQIEGTQGYGLGLHAGHYPHCTSSDCRAIDFMSMAGVSPWAPYVETLEIWIAMRVYPIRVAGNSGPLRGETSWDALGLPEERTTVTNKVRRVGEWDHALATEAVVANGGGNWHAGEPGQEYGSVRIALTMADQQIPALAGVEGILKRGMRAGEAADALVGLDAADQLGLDVARDLFTLVKKVETTGAPVEYIGTGPNTGIWIEG